MDRRFMREFATGAGEVGHSRLSDAEYVSRHSLYEMRARKLKPDHF